MKIERVHIMGIAIAIIMIVLDVVFFRSNNIFYLVLGIGVVAGAVPIILSIMRDFNQGREKEEMFLEFSRNLLENVRAGTPISKSILQIQNKDFGSLSPHIKKLANQVALGIPVKNALEIFSKDVHNPVVSRAIVLIMEAEKEGGEISEILESVAQSVSETEKLKKERRAAIYGLVMEGYIIFFIFLVIMIIMQYKVLPMTAQMSMTDVGVSQLLGISTGGTSASIAELSRPFFYLILIQGLFAGLVIGKLSEGTIKSGIKHSFILMIVAFLVSAGAKAFMG